MNITKLQENQKELDAAIAKNMKLDNRYLLIEKVTAFLVELSEMMNEWRGFKFWSENRKPNEFEWCGKCDSCNGHGVDIENRSCANCAGTGDGHKNPLLEEYADGLHFILSIANELKVKNLVRSIPGPKHSNVMESYLFINWLAGDIVESPTEHKVNYLFSEYTKLGYMLGFSDEEIEQAYYAKHEINYERQANGY